MDLVIFISVVLLIECHLVRTFERNYTTITLFTEPKTWNEAYDVCRSTGDRLLDLTYFSLYVAILDLSHRSPWSDIPVENGPAVWIGLHRHVNLLGEEYYSTQCEALSDFRIVNWNTEGPVVLGNTTQTEHNCVYDEITQVVVNGVAIINQVYNKGECSEKHMYFCQHESEAPCFFEEVLHHIGDTSADFSPDNDVIISGATNATCAERCLGESVVFPHARLKILEECWGYSMQMMSCTIHLVLKPNYFDTEVSSRVSSRNRQLYIKRCFTNAVNSSFLDVVPNNRLVPNTSCGVLDLGESTLTFPSVIIFEEKFTWNEALQLCMAENAELLHVESEKDYRALGHVADKYATIITRGVFWLGLHKPDPEDKPSMWLWANCEVGTMDNMTDTLDDKWCAIIDISSDFKLESKECKDKHHVICTGKWVSDTPSYNAEVEGIPMYEESLGPLDLEQEACERMCSNTTYKGMECWAYGYQIAANVSCFLYFSLDATFYEAGVIANNSYAFRQKMIWSESLRTNPAVIPDDEMFPYSCCNVTHVMSECAANTLDEHPIDIVSPTETKVTFIHYTTPATWNEAVMECSAASGALLQLNSRIKYHVVTNYLEEWKNRIFLSTSLLDIWIGLAQKYMQDPCSLRLTEMCDQPAVTAFTDPSYTDMDGRYCVAMGTAGMTKAYCNEMRTFVCEIENGACTMEPGDTVCPLSTDDILTRVSTTCNDDCLTMVHNGKECWSTVTYDDGSCDLLFYTDPFSCTSGLNYVPAGSISRKICFAFTLQGSLLPGTVDVRIEPHRGCFGSFTFPHIRNETRCSEVSTSTTAMTFPTTGQSTSSTFSIVSDTSRTPVSSSSEPPSSPNPCSLSSISSQSGSTTLSRVFWSTISLSDSTTSSMLTSKLSTSPSMSASYSASTVSSTRSSLSSSASLTISSIRSTQITATTTAGDHVYRPRPIYLSPCICRSLSNGNFVMTEWESWLQSDLVVPVKNTSRYRRAVTCAWDSRPSSAGIGGVAMSFLVTVGLYLLVMDIPTVRRGFRLVHRDRSVYRPSRRRRTTPLKY